MGKRCNNRLTVLGSKEQVQRFLKSNWDQHLHARYCERMENLPHRVVCLFETDEPPLRKVSWRRPDLILLLDYEIERQRIKGLAGVKAGQSMHCQFEY